MGFFFGSSSDKYSNKAKYLPVVDIKRLISANSISSLTQDEENQVEEMIINASTRHDDGKISLRQVDEILRHMKEKNQISQNDREAIMKKFVDYFGNK